jgi:hypothetical protein
MDAAWLGWADGAREGAAEGALLEASLDGGGLVSSAGFFSDLLNEPMMTEREEQG